MRLFLSQAYLNKLIIIHSRHVYFLSCLCSMTLTKHSLLSYSHDSCLVQAGLKYSLTLFDIYLAKQTLPCYFLGTVNFRNWNTFFMQIFFISTGTSRLSAWLPTVILVRHVSENWLQFLFPWNSGEFSYYYVVCSGQRQAYVSRELAVADWPTYLAPFAPVVS